MDLPIKDRITAGQALSKALHAYRNRPAVVVLALPRGGVPVAYEIARELHAQLDLILVRKLGAPGQRELAMGAIASGGIRVLNENVVSLFRASEDTIASIAAEEQAELERRESAYRGQRPRPDIEEKTIILVDDGVATGATMRAAIAALRQQIPAEIIVAVPVAPAETIEILEMEADKVICLATPEPFIAIGRWYENFGQVSDEEVQKILANAWGDEIR